LFVQEKEISDELLIISSASYTVAIATLSDSNSPIATPIQLPGYHNNYL
jgi:hypothetical protein